VPPQRFPLEIARRTFVPLVKDSTLSHFAPRDFGTAIKGKEASAKCHAKRRAWNHSRESKRPSSKKGVPHFQLLRLLLGDKSFEFAPPWPAQTKVLESPKHILNGPPKKGRAALSTFEVAAG
jgi:hypothetical protein